MAGRGPYRAGNRAPAALQGQVFPSYYSYQQARAQALGFPGYAAERTARAQSVGFASPRELRALRSDTSYRTFVRRAQFEGRSERWARSAYLQRTAQTKGKLTPAQMRQLQVDTGIAESMADTWYH